MSDRIDVSATITVNDQASPAIAKVREALGGIGNVAQQVGQKFTQHFAQLGTWKGLSGSVSNLGAAFGKLRSSIMGIAKPFAALVGIGAGFGLVEAVRGFEGYVSGVRALAREAPVLGATVEQLSGLQFAASRVGVGVGELTSALGRANVAIAKAATGKGTALTAMFGKLGIALRDSTGQMRSTADLLPELADAFARQTDPLVKARMATELFGRAAGPEMLRLLNLGAEEIDAFVAKGRELGLVFGDEQVAQATRFAKAQAEVRLAWQSLGTQLSQNLMPVLLPLVETFSKVLTAASPAIVKALTDAFQGLASTLEGIDWEATVGNLIDWIKWVNDAVQATVGWKGALAILVAFMAGPMIAAMAALLANPLFAAIAGLAAGALLIKNNWEGISGFFGGMWQEATEDVEGIASTFADAWAGIASGARDAWEGVAGLVGDLGARIAASFTWDNLRAAWEGVVDFFRGLWERVRVVFDTLIDWLGPFANLFAPLAIYKNWDGIAAFFQGVWDQVTAIFERAWAIIKPIIDALREGIGWVVDKMPSLSGIADKAKAVFNAPGNAVDWASDRLGGWWRGGGDSASVVERAAQSSIVQSATAAQAPAGRVDGEVDVKIHMTGAPPGTTIETAERGQVNATGDVGYSMAAA